MLCAGAQAAIVLRSGGRRRSVGACPALAAQIVDDAAVEQAACRAGAGRQVAEMPAAVPGTWRINGQRNNPPDPGAALRLPFAALAASGSGSGRQLPVMWITTRPSRFQAPPAPGEAQACVRISASERGVRRSAPWPLSSVLEPARDARQLTGPGPPARQLARHGCRHRFMLIKAALGEIPRSWPDAGAG